MTTSRHSALKFLLLLMMVLLSIIWSYLPRVNHTDLMALRLDSLSKSLHESSLTADEQRLTGLNKVRKWIYSGDGISWVVVTAEGKSGKSKLHDPTYCLLGAGWQLFSKNKLFFERGDATVLDLRKETDLRQCAYMYFNGRTAYSSSFRYWIDTAIHNLTLGLSGPEVEMIMLYPSRNLSLDEWDQCSMKLLPLLINPD